MPRVQTRLLVDAMSIDGEVAGTLLIEGLLNEGMLVDGMLTVGTPGEGLLIDGRLGTLSSGILDRDEPSGGMLAAAGWRLSRLEAEASSVHPLGRELLLGLVNDLEYTAKNGCDLRPPQNSFGSSVQGTLQELSSLSDGFVMMESPHVP